MLSLLSGLAHVIGSEEQPPAAAESNINYYTGTYTFEHTLGLGEPYISLVGDATEAQVPHGKIRIKSLKRQEMLTAGWNNKVSKAGLNTKKNKRTEEHLSRNKGGRYAKKREIHEDSGSDESYVPPYKIRAPCAKKINSRSTRTQKSLSVIITGVSEGCRFPVRDQQLSISKERSICQKKDIGLFVAEEYPELGDLGRVLSSREELVGIVRKSDEAVDKKGIKESVIESVWHKSDILTCINDSNPDRLSKSNWEEVSTSEKNDASN